MGIVTFTHLDEIPDRQLDHLMTLLAEDTKTAAPRPAQIYTTLEEVLRGERRRRAQRVLPHSAAAVSSTLLTIGELSDAEMQTIMRQMLKRRTAVAGGTPAVGRFFDAVLTALQATRTDQQDMLRCMDGDLQWR